MLERSVPEGESGMADFPKRRRADWEKLAAKELKGRSLDAKSSRISSTRLADFTALFIYVNACPE